MNTTTLLAEDGIHYLCAEPHGGIVADRTVPGPWETWEVERVSSTHVALKSHHGLYLSALDDATCLDRGLPPFSAVASARYVDIWELWEVIRHNGGIALKSHWGRWLCAESGGGGAVIANRPEAGPWETLMPSNLAAFGFGSIGVPTGDAPVRQIKGEVQRVGTSLGDASGPRIIHGCSDFAAIKKFREDPDAMKRQLDVVAPYQQYVRVLTRLGGWHWTGEGRFPSADLGVDPIRDMWFDSAFMGYAQACHERGIKLNLSSGDMNNASMSELEDMFRRIAQMCAAISPDLVWLSAVTNEMRGTWRPGETEENIRKGEHLLGIWAQHYPWGMRAISDPASQDRAGMKNLVRGRATMALIHDVRWQEADAIRRAFNTMYENYPDVPVAQDEPTGPNGSPPHGPHTRLVYQPTEDPNALLAIYTTHILTGQASTYFNDPALVSRLPLESTWGFKELPMLWRQMEIPEDIGQGLWKPGHHADAPLQVVGSGAERADSVIRGGVAFGIISGGSNWRVRSGVTADVTAFNATGRVWSGRVVTGEVLPIPGPAPVVVRFVF